MNDPIAAEYAERIKDQVRQRYGIDVDNTGDIDQQISAADGEAVHKALNTHVPAECSNVS
ncbi:hypothetical protein ACX80T_15635 [Arthrobacter sp. Sr33]|uniref:hypothetical protein n=1 Tax=Arthrobacter sp. TB 23 TaxID=494419 RepID=UPI0002D72749|nr:hypothetical protein [Arthrobacter sp. TB 23]